jgi:esterase
MASPEIFYEETGNPALPDIVFLHGLLGSSRNWRSVCKSLSEERHTFALDLRNHGKSFHSEDSSISAMANDLLRWLDEMSLQSVVLCGHSLGGKVAMRFASDHPERIDKLAVVDIAPRDYPPEHHVPTLDAMLELDLGKLSSRKDADEALSGAIPNWAFRQFLLTNLGQENSRFAWKSNLHSLRNSIAELSINPLSESDRYDGSTLFVRGGKSGYVRSEHFSLIRKHFPKSRISVLPEAGHDAHVEDREGFVQAIRSFLSG